MTVKETAENIKERMEALTEVIGQDGEGKDIIQPIFDKVIIGDFNSDEMPPGTVMSIRAVMEEDSLDFAGPLPPESPFTVPWHLSLYVSGQVSEATLRIYELVPVIKTSLNNDLSFNGSCTEGYWDKPKVIYDEDMRTSNSMVSGARFRIRTNY